MRQRAVPLIILLALLLTACSSDDDGSGDTTTTEAEVTTTADATTTSEAQPTTTAGTETTTTGDPGATTTTIADADSEEAVEDLLTMAAGTTLVSATIGETIDAGAGLRVIDGSEEEIGIGRDDAGPAVFVYELPAPTSFEQFLVPAIQEAPGNTTFYRDVTIEGSSESADAGFETIATAELAELGPDETAQEITPATETPVRWLRVTLENGLLVEEGDEGNTSVRFTELIGRGTQDEVPTSTAFTGTWEFRSSDAPDREGPIIELKQEGTTVSGCLETVALTGTVTGAVARLQGIDSRNDRESVYLFIVNADDELQGVESTNGGVFRAHFGPVAADATSACSDEPPPPPPSCDATVYVNFDVNSADIRPDSEAVLDDLYAGLEGTEGAITIVGHTSTEGDEAANLDLSQRRAEAVAAALAARGLDESQLDAAGKGETEPLLPDEDDESARALNRRVQIACS